MLKKEVTYEDFNGNTVTEILYFNISKSEVVEMQYGDVSELLKQVTAKGAKGSDILAAFKKIIGMAYGVKSEDGRRFHKDPDQTSDFLNSPAYDAVFMELVQGDTEAVLKFIQGVLPSDLATDENMAAVAAQAGIKVDVQVPVTTPSVAPVRVQLPQPKPENGTPAAFKARLDKMREQAAEVRAPVGGKPLEDMTQDELLAALRTELAKKQSS